MSEATAQNSDRSQSHRVDAHPKKAKGHLWRNAFATVGFYFGGYLGFQLLAVGPPPPGEYMCGLALLPATMFGMPAGALSGFFLGAVIGWQFD